MKHVWLVARELHTRKVTMRDGEKKMEQTDLIGWFPVLAFPDGDKGRDRAREHAEQQCVIRPLADNIVGAGQASVRSHHSSTESRYWVDFPGEFPTELSVWVVHRVQKV